MTKKDKWNRREFMKSSGVATAALPTLSARSYARISGSNNRLAVGIIGCGSIGQAHLTSLLSLRNSHNVEVRAVCDIYETRAQSFQDQLSRESGQVSVFTNHRSILESPDLDYVVVATPEHWHSQQTIDALDAGLHIYCEKPLTHKVEEAHKVWSKAKETGHKLQVGVQGMSDDSYEAAGRAIRAGKLGTVVQAQVDYVRNYSPHQGPWRTGVRTNLPKPPDLDWDTWLGPAPKRPWDPQRFFEWRCYRDYSGGVATDLFVHRLTRILKACGLTYPSRVACLGGIYVWDDGRELPDNIEALLEYPAVKGVTNGMTVHLLGTMANSHMNQHIIRGKDASLIFNSDGWKIISESDGEILENHRNSGAENIAVHHVNLQSSIRENEALHCPVELGVYGVTAVRGVNLSWFSGRLLEWNDTGKKWV